MPKFYGPSPESCFDAFRKRPSMYTGAETPESIALFLYGYEYAIRYHDIDPIDDPFFIPDDFNEWVGYRLRLLPGSMGYPTLIRKRTKTDKEATEKFFELLDEYRKRTPHVVATFADRGRTHSIVTYTDDPGFFVCTDPRSNKVRQGSFCPDLGWLESWHGIKRELLTIVDPNWTPIERHPDYEA